ncbi:YihY/virulence factor BrkB family protein [Leptolyngbya sp. AN03gr2]|uniref:YihY/virulence factor BrkB family protein n=1 Tax=unclassified Leptolyngbya TaxID=2650499 RepID=UPI003D316D06
MTFRGLWALLKQTIIEWQQDKIPLLAAALAYYTVFSLAPLLVIAIAIVGAVLGQQAAQNQIVMQFRGLIGEQGAQAIQAIINNAQQPGSGGTVATIVSIITLLFGASVVFGQLQEALNTIWEVQPKPGLNIKGFLQNRLLSFAMVLVIGFLLLVSLFFSAALAALESFFGTAFPNLIELGRFINIVLTLGGAAVLFALIYKVLPDVQVSWRYLWIGAGVTSVLFTIGKSLIGFYLGNSSVSSSYGAASSVIGLLIWIYYSAQILLFGAEFTQVYAKRQGALITASSYAQPKNKSH